MLGENELIILLNAYRNPIATFPEAENYFINHREGKANNKDLEKFKQSWDLLIKEKYLEPDNRFGKYHISKKGERALGKSYRNSVGRESALWKNFSDISLRYRVNNIESFIFWFGFSIILIYGINQINNYSPLFVFIYLGILIISSMASGFMFVYIIFEEIDKLRWKFLDPLITIIKIKSNIVAVIMVIALFIGGNYTLYKYLNLDYGQIIGTVIAELIIAFVFNFTKIYNWLKNKIDGL
jgi:hypothetical protein